MKEELFACIDVITEESEHKPIGGDIIVMDEPFKGLDDKLKVKIIDYIKRKSIGKTMTIVTHNREDRKHYRRN